jgi:hypothetical protein
MIKNDTLTGRGSSIALVLGQIGGTTFSHPLIAVRSRDASFEKRAIFGMAEAMPFRSI